MSPGYGLGTSLWAAMGRLARGDPAAGWRAWERRTVLGGIDGEGDRDNLDTRRIKPGQL